MAQKKLLETDFFLTVAPQSGALRQARPGARTHESNSISVNHLHPRPILRGSCPKVPNSAQAEFDLLKTVRAARSQPQSPFPFCRFQKKKGAKPRPGGRSPATIAFGIAKFRELLLAFAKASGF